MRTRTIEVPLCDKCSRDGQILTVVTATGDRFTICRCEKHEAALRAEGGREEAVTAGGEVKRKPRVKPDQLLSAISNHPNERPGYYAKLFGATAHGVGLVARQLVKEGLVVKGEDGRSLRLV